MPKKLSFTPTNRLRELRSGAALSLAKVAEGCNTNAAQIQKLETGERDLDYGWMLRLAAFFNVRPADLLLAHDGGLSANERRVIDTMREVPSHVREVIDAMIESQQRFRSQGEVVELETRAAS